MCKLNSPVKGGASTLRESDSQAKKTIEKLGLQIAKPESRLPKYPKELQYLVHWAQALHMKDPLTYSEVKAWSELMQIALNPWEVDILMRLDTTYHALRT